MQCDPAAVQMHDSLAWLDTTALRGLLDEEETLMTDDYVSLHAVLEVFNPEEDQPGFCHLTGVSR